MSVMTWSNSFFLPFKKGGILFTILFVNTQKEIVVHDYGYNFWRVLCFVLNEHSPRFIIILEMF